MSYLREKDYLDITKFFYRISHAKGDFREKVLFAVDEIFGYRRVTFWLAGLGNILIDPRFHNVEKNIIQAYADQYYKYDPFDYNQLDKQQRKKNVMVLDDIINSNSYFKDNIYYQDVLSQFAYNNKMVVYLKDGEKYLGGMSFLRNKNEKPFDPRDKELCKIIANYVSFLLKKELALHEAEKENLLLKDAMEINSSGVVLLDADLNIKYINQAGEKYLNQIFVHTDSSLKEIFYHILCLSNYESPDQENSGDSLAFMFTIGNISIKAGSTQNKGQNQYYMLLSDKTLVLAQPAAIGRAFAVASDNLGQNIKLTGKENQVAQLIVEGYTNQEIADIMFISLSTVKSHIYQIYKKVEVPNRASLIAKLNKSKSSI